MAAFDVTPEALACIRALIEHEEIRKPLVVVNWAHGDADLKRGADGEVIWEREPRRWLATVFDLAALEEAGAPWFGSTVELYGYPFNLIGKRDSPDLERCTLDCEGGKLVVYESAT